LQTAVKSRPAEMRDAGLEGIETIIQGKQSVAPEGHHNSLFSLGQNCRAGLLWPRLTVFNRSSLTPLGDRLRVDPEFPAQLRERSLRSLYCCSDSVRCRGASVTNLSHRASFHSCERITPSNRGIKHLRCAVPRI